MELRRAFDRLDLKRDGKLDAHELGQMFNKLGHSLKKVRASPAEVKLATLTVRGLTAH